MKKYPYTYNKKLLKKKFNQKNLLSCFKLLD